eukprot:5224329-Pleurochrysis_carterae.AAC.1
MDLAWQEIYANVTSLMSQTGASEPAAEAPQAAAASAALTRVLAEAVRRLLSASLGAKEAEAQQAVAAARAEAQASAALA